jgi:3-hydroxybutyryl-CoA dehydratase
MPDATPQFKQQLQEAFQSIQVGQTFTFRRTFTEGDVALFCGVTGDYNPYHIDHLFLQESWFKRPVIPGLLTASMVTHIGGMIGFLATEMNFQFPVAVYVGDTITCTVTFTEKDETKRMVRAQATFVNQDGVEVIRCTFAGFPANVRLAN